MYQTEVKILPLRGMDMANVTKSWYAQWQVDTGRLVDGKPLIETMKSRNYHVIEAAQKYVAEIEKSGVCVPGSAQVRSRKGNDKIESTFFPLAI